jgi:uncharacterized membrane protein YjjB (DUF3815 family)
MFIRLWNHFVLAVAALAALGAFVLAHGLAGDPLSLAKSTVFAAFAVGFLGTVLGALFVHRY